MPSVTFREKGCISAPFIQRNPRKDMAWICRTNWTTLTVCYSQSPLWSELDTDLIAVFRRPNAMDWWFWIWDGSKWRSVDWDNLVCNEKMDIVREFYVQYDSLVDLHVPWKNERGLITLIALESA